MLAVNPYLIAGPAMVSFSGGRTSAYMLHEMVKAYGGTLPDGMRVVFANTGKERAETLRFVHECGVRWNVKIHWVEWRPGAEGFEEVGFNSASRDGRPFKELIAKKNYLPNAVTRFCTQELKIRAMLKFCRSLGWERWQNVVGLRYDEGLRVFKALERNDAGKEQFTTVMPLSRARVTKRGHVLPFWLGDNADPLNLTHPLPQGFDLGLRDYEGNCDLCFLKSKAKLATIIREHPKIADWWIAQEATIITTKASGARFVTEYSYADLARQVHDQGHLFDGWTGDDDHDAECGLLCQP